MKNRYVARAVARIHSSAYDRQMLREGGWLVRIAWAMDEANAAGHAYSPDAVAEILAERWGSAPADLEATMARLRRMADQRRATDAATSPDSESAGSSSGSPRSVPPTL